MTMGDENVADLTVKVLCQIRDEIGGLRGDVGRLEQGQTDLKAEFFLPSAISELLVAGRARMRVLPTDASWFGVTYREDKPIVMASIRRLIEQGVYPSDLWGD